VHAERVGVVVLSLRARLPVLGHALIAKDVKSEKSHARRKRARQRSKDRQQRGYFAFFRGLRGLAREKLPKSAQGAILSH